MLLCFRTMSQIQEKKSHKTQSKCEFCEELNKEEANLLNSLFDKSGNTYEFTGKKIAFITGNSGNKLLLKEDFFNTCIKPWVSKNQTPQVFMIEFSIDEKNKSGGCDALVLSWVKILTNKQKKRIIGKLYKNDK